MKSYYDGRIAGYGIDTMKGILNDSWLLIEVLVE